MRWPWQILRDRREEVRTLKLEVRALQTREMNRRAREAQASGVDMTSGKFNYEPNTDLQAGSKKWETLAKMADDPHIQAALRANAMPLQQAKWEVEPASDNAKDVEVAEFVAANLLRQSSDRYGQDYWIQNPWETRLGEILDMLQSGFSMFSTSWRVVDGKRVIDRLQWLEPESVDPYGWDLAEDDSLTAVKRTYATPNLDYHYQDPLPASQLMLYVWNLKGARYEGRPFIRSMYGAWYRKDFILRQAAIWAQKAGAPAPLASYPSHFTEDQVNDFIDFVKENRGSSPAESFFVSEMGDDGAKAEVAWAGGTDAEVDRMRGLIDGENLEIAHGGGTKSQQLGETQSGARAVGETLRSDEMVLREAIAATVCAFENHGVANILGVVERVVKTNFAVREMPRLKCSKVDPYEGLDQGVLLWEKGILPKTPDARRMLCEMGGITLPDDQYEVEPPAQPDGMPFAPGDTPPPDGSNGEGTSEGDVAPDDADEAGRGLGLEVSESQRRAEEFARRIAPLLEPVGNGKPAGLARHRNRLELEGLNLAQIQEAFRTGERDCLTHMRLVHRQMIAELLQRNRAGKITTTTVGSQRRSKFRKEKAAVREMQAILDRVGRDGAEHVDEELDRLKVLADAFG